MLDMRQTAKDLIQKGEELGDDELISMGMTMLEKYKQAKFQHSGQDEEFNMMKVLPQEEGVPDDDDDELPEEYYQCTNCDAIVPYDKPGRKKCPSCKKHTLLYFKPEQKIIPKPKINHRASADEFTTQIRGAKKSARVRYNEAGEQEGVYTRTEQVDGVTNVWDDEDRTEGQDEQNELLKRFTKVSPRRRAPVKMMKVVCDECKTIHLEHPLHVGGRAKYVCNRCLKKKTRI